ncbi:MAG: nucleotidyltransferase family protein [Pseudomonadota bacterium]
MADTPHLAIAVLAAGSSRRFGEADKLKAKFRGKPLGLHASDTLAQMPCREGDRILVTADPHHACSRGWKQAGFTIVKNPNADEGMGTSVAVAARVARRAGCDALLIALADMPLVPRAHYQALASAALARGDDAIIASSDGTSRMPPAAFGKAHFDTLAQMSGDQGARVILAQGKTIVCPPEWLADIDTREALAALG